MPINDRTARLSLPLPHVNNLLEDDVGRLREALTTLDTAFPLSSTTDTIPEGIINQYFTVSRVRAVLLTGLSVATNAAIVATDSLLVALGKLQGQLTAQLAVVVAHVGAGGSAHSAATGAANGFMSAADKTKLDGVTLGALFDASVVSATTIGQTSFTVPGGYTAGAIDVLLDGVELDSTDYTATTGTTVVLAVGVSSASSKLKVKNYHQCLRA